MWEPRRLTTLWTSAACYRDRFTSFKNPNATIHLFGVTKGHLLMGPTLICLHTNAIPDRSRPEMISYSWPEITVSDSPYRNFNDTRHFWISGLQDGRFCALYKTIATLLNGHSHWRLDELRLLNHSIQFTGQGKLSAVLAGNSSALNV
jgi:hypothetical protein